MAALSAGWFSPCSSAFSPQCRPSKGRGIRTAKGATCSESISDVFDRVSPAVVSITATSINPSSLVDRVERVVGSGFLIDPSG
jgi:S1-C subfamily serine protease